MFLTFTTEIESLTERESAEKYSYSISNNKGAMFIHDSFITETEFSITVKETIFNLEEIKMFVLQCNFNTDKELIFSVANK